MSFLQMGPITLRSNFHPRFHYIHKQFLQGTNPAAETSLGVEETKTRDTDEAWELPSEAYTHRSLVSLASVVRFLFCRPIAVMKPEPDLVAHAIINQLQLSRGSAAAMQST